MVKVILRRAVRDAGRGGWHGAGEAGQICGNVRRADSDTNKPLRGRFADRSGALLFEEEFGWEIGVADLPKQGGA